MSERVRGELINIANEIEAEGQVTDEIRNKLRDLLANASLLIALGPTRIVVRNNDDDARVMPDSHDYELYQSLVSMEGFSELFASEGWGSAVTRIEKTDFKGTLVPALRVEWTDKVAFVKDWHNKEAFTGQIGPYLAGLELLLGAKWIEWVVELE